MKQRLTLFALAAAIILAPLSLLFATRATFNFDWQNNLWMIDYCRQSLSANFSYPEVYNVASHVGVPQPIFYGPLLYPLLTVLSEPLNSALAIRLACVIVWTLQFTLVYQLGRRLRAGRFESLTVAILMSWSIYPLTNLYNRGALAEFFGTAFLACALAAGGLAIYSPHPRRRGMFALLGALCAALALGSHAPTALIGGGILIAMAIPAVFLNLGHRPGAIRRRLIFAVGLALLVAAAISPWAYAVGRFSSRFSISVPNRFYRVAGGWQRFEWIDSWRARLTPLPLPDQWTIQDTQMHRTRHLDAQWNFPLVLLVVCNAITLTTRRRNHPIRRAALALFITSAASAVALLLLSICTPLQDALTHPIGAAIQFPYRLVSHVNLALLVTLFAAWAARIPNDSSTDRRPTSQTILVIALILSAAGLGLKLKHAAAVMVMDANSQAESKPDWLTRLPATFVGQDDYTLQIPERLLPDSMAASSQSGSYEVDAPTGAGPIGGTQDASVTFPKSGWVATSVLNFPWNRLIVDGTPVPFDEVHNLYFHQTVEVSAGTHTFGYRFEPDPTWVALNRLSGIVLSILTAGTLFLLVFPRRRYKIGEPRDAT